MSTFRRWISEEGAVWFLFFVHKKGHPLMPKSFQSCLTTSGIQSTTFALTGYLSLISLRIRCR